jgi:hypothetical protein
MRRAAQRFDSADDANQIFDDVLVADVRGGAPPLARRSLPTSH